MLSAGEKLSDQLQRAEDVEAEIAQALADQIAAVRAATFDLFDPVRDFNARLSLPADFIVADAIGEVRDLVRLLLLTERTASIVLAVFALILAVAGGVLIGDRTGRSSAAPETAEEIATFRRALSESEAAAFDAGRPLLVPPEERAAPQQAARSRSSVALSPDLAVGRVSAGLWLELFLCVLIDAAGSASLFSPAWEFADVVYALFAAFVIEVRAALMPRDVT
jgi:hypothetical protein